MDTRSSGDFEPPPRVGLKVIDPSQSPQESVFYLAKGDQVTVGRSSNNDIILGCPGVSRNHLSISWNTGNLLVKDLGSKNGTKLNNSPLMKSCSLGVGDCIILSDARIVVLPFGSVERGAPNSDETQTLPVMNQGAEMFSEGLIEVSYPDKQQLSRPSSARFLPSKSAISQVSRHRFVRGFFGIIASSCIGALLFFYLMSRFF